VVAVTAFAMKGDEERIRESGCEAYLSKPVSVSKSIETIRRFLGVGHSMPAVSRSRTEHSLKHSQRATASRAVPVRCP
jgi:CheY-like chemotaxis protein